MAAGCRNDDTFPRLADPLGYVDKDDIFHAVKAIVAAQRDYGRRDDRKQARLKYLVQEWGIDKFRWGLAGGGPCLTEVASEALCGTQEFQCLLVPPLRDIGCWGAQAQLAVPAPVCADIAGLKRRAVPQVKLLGWPCLTASVIMPYFSDFLFCPLQVCC